MYRKVKNVGLADEYNNHTSTAHTYVRLLMMMAFINPSLKGEAFDDLVKSFDSESINNGTRDKMVVVFDYFQSTWLNGNIDTTSWYFAGCEMRTINL